MSELNVIPTAVERRLILNFLGFRLIGGCWIRAEACLDQEAIDRMDPEQWEAYVARWQSPAKAGGREIPEHWHTL
jgi:hypothetical protein